MYDYFGIKENDNILNINGNINTDFFEGIKNEKDTNR
jgi:hypothetical protein